MSLPAKLKDPTPTRTKRVKSPAHRKWVRSHRCCVPGCDGVPIEAAHVRLGLPQGEQAGMGMKPGDMWVISLCSHHHSIQHQMGECAFQYFTKINMVELAKEFAAKSPHRGKLR